MVKMNYLVFFYIICYLHISTLFSSASLTGFSTCIAQVTVNLDNGGVEWIYFSKLREALQISVILRVHHTLHEIPEIHSNFNFLTYVITYLVENCIA